MTSAFDPLQLVVDDLKFRQLTAVQDELPGTVSGHSVRMSAATARGLELMSRLADRQAGARLAVDRLVALSLDNARFAFLHAIPDAPVLSMHRALALEQAVFGQTTDSVGELALLTGLFTVLLDGLLDEAPEHMAGVAAWLDEVMSQQAWASGGPLPALGRDGQCLHPVAELMVWAAAEIIRQVTSQTAWGDPMVRREFAAASVAAYEAEVRSTRFPISRGAGTAVARGIVDKSSSCIWAGALLPFCVHGWHTRIDPRRYESFARSVGIYGGWIDDTVDIGVDLRADRWSSVLLELERGAQVLGLSGDERTRLTAALRMPLVTLRLARGGIDRLRSVRTGLRALGLAEDGLLDSLADMTWACLADGVPEPAT
jgi:hypothetical protein